MLRKNSGSSSPTTERFEAELDAALHIQEQEKVACLCDSQFFWARSGGIVWVYHEEK